MFASKSLRVATAPTDMTEDDVMLTKMIYIVVLAVKLAYYFYRRDMKKH